MAFGVKYRGEFTDNELEDWKVEILEDGYSSDITTMVHTGTPLEFSWPASGDDIYDQIIRGSEAQINVYSETQFAYSELFTTDNIYFKVNIYKDTDLYWTGWVTANTWSEPYADTPYPVTIPAVDGLGILKSFQFTELSLTGRQTAAKIIFDALALIGVTGFTEFVNIYEEGMLMTVDDSPLAQAYIDVDLFYDFTVYEAIEETLRVFNASIRQSAGDMVVYRYPELGDSTMYGRVFSSATAYTSTTRTPAQFINRTTTASNFKDAGGQMMIIPQRSKVYANQDYGQRDSWVNNHKFSSDTHNISVGTFTDWTKTMAVLPVSAYIDGETEGVMLSYAVGSPGVMISQDCASSAITSATDILGFEVDWGILNAHTGAVTTAIITIVVQCGSYYLDEDTNLLLKWAGSLTGINLAKSSLAVGWSGWSTFKRRIPGLPADGPLTVSLYETFTSGGAVYGAIKNLRIFSTSDDIVVKSTYVTRGWLKIFENKVLWKVRRYIDVPEIINARYETDNSVTGEEMDIGYILGDAMGADMDNVLPQFKGALGLVSPIPDSVAAFVSDYAATYAAGGVTLTQGTGIHTNDLIFTAIVAGVDFTGATTITNTSGTLDGTVVNTQANVPAVERTDTITLSGSSGAADVTVDGLTKTAIYSTSLTQTATNFVTSWAADYLSQNIVLTSSGADLIFTGQAGKGEFTGSTTINNTSGSLDGDAAEGSVTPGVARIDTITIDGGTGTADILCDGTTEELARGDTLTYTEAWNTRGGSEDAPIVQVVGDEIGAQFARPKHLLDLTIYERSNAEFDLIGNLQDDLNQYSGNNRKFIVNRADYDVRMRKWELGLNELI